MGMLEMDFERISGVPFFHSSFHSFMLWIQEQNWEIVSLVSARKLEFPSSARLSLEPFQLGLAQLGLAQLEKFQLELITNFFPIFWTKISRNGHCDVRTGSTKTAGEQLVATELCSSFFVFSIHSSMYYYLVVFYCAICLEIEKMELEFV